MRRPLGCRPSVVGESGGRRRGEALPKNPTFAALAHMNIRVRGRAKVGRFTAFAAPIANLRATDRWNAQCTAVRKLNYTILGNARRRPGRRTYPATRLTRSQRPAGTPAEARRP